MLATVSTHTTAIEAHIVALRLHHEDIPSFLGAEHHIGLDWSVSVALGGVRVQVPPSYFSEAKMVINRINSGEYAHELNMPKLLPEEPECPTCSSTEAIPQRWSEKIALLVVFLYSLPIPYNQHKYQCGTCGHKWEEHRERCYSPWIIGTSVVGIALLLIAGLGIYCEWCKIYCANLSASCNLF